jgi:hypothetical protein
VGKLFLNFISKGSLISESLSLLLQSSNCGPPKWMVPKGKELSGVIWYVLFGDLSQSEKLSEINPPLYSRSGFISVLYWFFDNFVNLYLLWA